jgi:hypothetical protein
MSSSPSPPALLQAADDAYMNSEWALARDRLEAISAAHPAWAELMTVPLMLAHCRIELAPAEMLEGLMLERGAAGRHERERQLAVRLRLRAMALARAGEHARASKLLRALADYDLPIADAIVSCLGPARPTRTRDAAPPVADDPTLSDAAVAATRQRFAGARVLLIYRQLFTGQPGRACEPVDNLARSAARFGLDVRVRDAYAPPPGVEPADYASWLQAEILDMRPHVIVYDDLFESGVSASSDALAEQLAAVLQGAREVLGVRVVKSLLDAWLVLEHGAARMTRGLGACVDLLHHMHPALRESQDDAARAASFCYPVPFELPAPTVAPGTIARAGFAGGISWFNIARLVWWVEAGKRGLPFDFLESHHSAAVLRSDQDYANLFHQYQLSVNLTRRSNGTRILTGRSIDIPLAGGVLLEEASPNSAYFLAAGEHYEPFGTLDELAALIDDLLRDDVRRQRLARAGQRWVTDFYTGDRFWAGLLARLFD